MVVAGAAVERVNALLIGASHRIDQPVLVACRATALSARMAQSGLSIG
jgi:hypothetical protein